MKQFAPDVPQAALGNIALPQENLFQTVGDFFRTTLVIAGARSPQAFTRRDRFVDSRFSLHCGS